MLGKASGNDRNSRNGRCKDSCQAEDVLSNEIREAIRHMVSNISKSFIADWYTSISPTNHDFVASCETLIEDTLERLAELCVGKLDKYKVGQLVTSLLHDHILNADIRDKIQSVESQIDCHEYDICQSSVVRLFGLVCTEDLRRVIFTTFDTNLTETKFRMSQNEPSKQFQGPRQDQSEIPSLDGTRTTSALYTMVIALLTKAVFMPIFESISEPNWLYAVIIWLCKKEEREKARRAASLGALVPHSSTLKYPSRQFDAHVGGEVSSRPTTSILLNNSRTFRSLDLEEGIDVSSANINFDNPICDSLKRPLDNIEIYATEEVKTSSSCYVLYCIGYDGLCYKHPSAGFIPNHPDVPTIDKRATHTGNRKQLNTMHKLDNPEVTNRKSFRKRMTVKRRFREFVILQLRLEENPKIRPYMKNIPKPTKLKAATQNIFSLPGITNIKLDQSTIKLRQRFLERFLNALNSSPFIANSYEFKEFFSYNVDSAINISKSKSLILQVNLNKVFVDSVRSAFSILRATFPASDDCNLISNPDPDAWLTELQQSTLKLHVQTRTCHSKMTLEKYLDYKLLSIASCSKRSGKVASIRHNLASSTLNLNSWDGSFRQRMVKSNSAYSTNSSSFSYLLSRSSSSNTREIGGSSRSSSTESIYHDAIDSVDPKTELNDSNYSIQGCDNVPIASKLIDIIHFSLSRDSGCSTSYINYAARILIGKTIERHAIRLLEAALNLKNATFCINGMTSSIWDESDDPPLDLENASLSEAATHLSKLLEDNYTNYPFIPKNFLGSLLRKQLEFYLSQLASQKRNKFFIYSLFVHLLDELENSDNC